MKLPRCARPRPTNADTRRQFFVVQTWRAECGCLAELVLEPHAGHVHCWPRWGGTWQQTMEPEHWRYFRAYVRPVVRDVVDAVRGRATLDEDSAHLLAGAAA